LTLRERGGNTDVPKDFRRTHKTISGYGADADNASSGDNQTSRDLLLVRSLGDSTGDLVEGVASLHDWASIPD